MAYIDLFAKVILLLAAIAAVGFALFVWVLIPFVQWLIGLPVDALCDAHPWFCWSILAVIISAGWLAFRRATT